MRHRMLVVAVVAAFAFALLGGAVRAQQPPGPTVVYRTSMEVTSPPAAFDAINLVLDIAPGAWTPLHSHGGQGIVTVLEGEVIHRPEGGAEQRVRAGESFIETPGHAHRAGNDGQTNARIVFTVLLPKGAEVTTVHGDPGPNPPPAPKLVYRTMFEAANPPSQFDLINLVLDFAPGAWTPLHTHGGQGMVTVLDGEIVHRPQGGAERVVRAGESFQETPGHPHMAGNTSSAKTRVLFTVLLPKGAELTTVVAAPQPAAAPAALPNTGAPRAPATRGWAIVLVATTLVAAGWRLRRNGIRG
ncbi:MAG: cupin domain-containing protein [Chloroflexota bacterium]|nr:cupin domain-containing protein [Chloroflexota bacterium]